MIDFGEVVILTGEPEDGYVHVAGYSRFMGQPNRRSCLVHGKQRTTQNAYLLTGYDNVRSIANLLQRWCEHGRGILRSQQSDDTCPMRISLPVLCPLPATISGDRPIPGAHRSFSGTIVQKDARQARNSGNRKTLGVQCRFSGFRRH